VTKYQIPNLLEELQSTEAYIRSDAIKKIIKGKINDEHIIHALRKIIENDPYQAVRNFARAALDVFGIEHSEVEVDTQAREEFPINLVQAELAVPKEHSKLGIASFAFALLFIFFLVVGYLEFEKLDPSTPATASQANIIEVMANVTCFLSLLNPLSILLGANALFQKNTKKLFAILGISLSLLSGCLGISYFIYLLRGM
jgi:hypothetical protein